MTAVMKRASILFAMAKPVVSLALCGFTLTFFPLRYSPLGWGIVPVVALGSIFMTLTVQWSRALVRRLRGEVS